MAQNQIDNETGSYELDLDDTISAWDSVVEEAVAAVQKKGDVREIRDSQNRSDDEPEEPAGEAAEVSDEAEGHDAVEAEAAEGGGLEAVEAEAAEDESAAAARAEREDDTAVRELRDQLVRTLADFDNFRKRTEREKASIERYALFDVLKDFLAVLDNLERALAASGSAEDLKTGVEMIVRQFADLLGRHGVEPVAAVGEAFDPTVHEAVTREEDVEVERPTVKLELQRGYRLHDRLLRPALVTVAMPPPPPPEPPRDEVEEDAVEEMEETPDEDVVRATEVS